MKRFNNWLALKITNGVSTMWCAYVFCVISLTSLPSTLKEHSVNADVQWVAQTFLQLVLLSVIMVGQKVQAQMTIELHQKVDRHHEHLAELRRLMHRGPVPVAHDSDIGTGLDHPAGSSDAGTPDKQVDPSGD